jgi:hypothetical protein
VIRRLRRASVFAAVAAVAVLAPALGDAAAVPFLAAAGLAFFGVRDGEWFETLALPGDREEERLYGFVAFALAAAGLSDRVHQVAQDHQPIRTDMLGQGQAEELGGLEFAIAEIIIDWIIAAQSLAFGAHPTSAQDGNQRMTHGCFSTLLCNFSIRGFFSFIFLVQPR